MGYSNTTKLALRKDDGNEKIVDWRGHNNDNLDRIDATVGNLIDAINNAKLLLGQLGYDQNGNPIVDAATARSTLDAAQSEQAAGSLYDAEQAIGVNAGNIATNASDISSLQNLVDDIITRILPIARGGSGQSGIASEYVVENIATSGTGCSVQSATYQQWGKVAQLYLGIYCDTAKSSGNVLATIASNKRPMMTTPLTNISNVTKPCAVYDNGQVQAKTSLSAGESVFVIGTYLLQ